MRSKPGDEPARLVPGYFSKASSGSFLREDEVLVFAGSTQTLKDLNPGEYARAILWINANTVDIPHLRTHPLAHRREPSALKS